MTLAKRLGVAHIASGDLFRQEQANGTELGILAKQYMDRGELVPNEVTIKMILGRISQPDCASGYILDGFPRSMEQGAALDAALAKKGKGGIDRVVYIKVSDAELVSRLGGRWICRAAQHPYHVVNNPPMVAGICDIDGSELFQRADDSAETARKRLEVYHQQTVPLVQHYEKKGVLTEVDGQKPIPEVAKQLASVLQ